MELRRYLRLIRQRLILVLIAILVGAGVGYATTSRVIKYTAVTTIYVGNLNVAANPEDLALQASLNNIVATYAQMIPTPVIAQKAIDQTGLDRFPGQVASETTALVVTGTDLIDVSVTDLDPANAVRLANGVSKAFVAQVSAYQATSTAQPTGSDAGAVPNEPAHVFQPATYAFASSSGLTGKMLLGGIFGLVLSIFLILILDYLDITIKSPEELERRVGLPVLGIIPLFNSLPLSNTPSAGYANGTIGG